MADTENTPFRDIVQSRAPSKFFAKEMIFDCVRGHVSASRASAIEKMIDEDEELKHQRNLVNIAGKYCSLLAKIEINEKFLAEISGNSGALERVRSRIVPRSWPIPVKWGVEAFIVSAIVASATLALFWSNIETLIPQKQELLLAHEKMSIERDTNTTITDQTEIAEVHKSLARETPMEEGVEPPTAPPPTKPQAQAVAAKPVPQAPTLPAPTSKPAAAAPGASASQTPPNTAAVSVSAPTPAEIATPTSATPTTSTAAAKPATPPVAQKPKGYVYKQYMSLQNLETIATDITAKIVELGGEKAGEVELGWRKPNGRYYHFVLPKDNRTVLVEFLKSFGVLTEVKDPHVRVMPEGEERYILWIEGN